MGRGSREMGGLMAARRDETGPIMGWKDVQTIWMPGAADGWLARPMIHAANGGNEAGDEEKFIPTRKERSHGKMKKERSQFIPTRNGTFPIHSHEECFPPKKNEVSVPARIPGRNNGQPLRYGFGAAFCAAKRVR